MGDFSYMEKRAICLIIFIISGIIPFDSNIFTDEDFQAAENEFVERIENLQAGANGETHEEERVIQVVFHDEAGANEDVSTSTNNEPLTSTQSLDDTLISIGPLRPGKVKKKSNRGRKAMKSVILTSSPIRNELKQRAEKTFENKMKRLKALQNQVLKGMPKESVSPRPSPKQRTVAKPKPRKARKIEENRMPQESMSPKPLPKQRTVAQPQPRKAGKVNVYRVSAPSEDEDFCIICMGPLPLRLTQNNSISCNSCKRPVHLKCANIMHSYFTCKHCDSDDDSDA